MSLIIIIALLCGLLGALSGADNSSKVWRRWLVPFLLTVTCYQYLHNLQVLWLMLLVFPFSLGYGMPDFSDEGSYFAKLMIYYGYTTFQTEIYTRSLIIGIVTLITVILPIITGQWILWLVSSVLMILIYILLGGDAFIKNEGMFKVGNYDLLVEEYSIYTLISLLILIQVL